MSGVGAATSGLPVGYDQLLDMALHDALGKGQSVSVTATAGSSTLAINGSGAYLFDTSRIASGPNAATFIASPDGIKDTITLSAAAQQSLSSGQIALDILRNAARPTVANGTAPGPATPAAGTTGQTAAIDATVQTAVGRAPTQTGYISEAAGFALLAVQTGIGQTQTGDNSDAAETALLDQFAAYQASPAAVANFQSLLMQGEQASPADRFYATYADADNFQLLTTYMTDAQKASFTTAFNNRTLTVGGEADLGGILTAGSSSTVTDTVQGESISGTQGFLAGAAESPNTVLADAGLFGTFRVSWTDAP